ncbi:hypothetical protein O181_059715 [Austropuccinia psidii MF-1]|uniref:Uncharacterized protein n=1 Tax=Austropuccinia psidii MF-1 TaxID=1389203 RepID=A0A9Q3HYZ0_9BASI|nr:hypothetical protein [Austropuccinia psidii MF-1]
MEKHNALSPVNPGIRTKTLSTTWFFKKKTEESGNLYKFKAQICIKHYHQKEGADYIEVLSPNQKTGFSQTSPDPVLQQKIPQVEDWHQMCISEKKT